jgi:hypothetical protein
VVEAVELDGRRGRIKAQQHGISEDVVAARVLVAHEAHVGDARQHGAAELAEV